MGRVYLVGAGPGDPELLTLRALRRLQEADVVIYDKLVGPEILEYADPDADRVYVGKSKGRHSRSQAEINALMAHHAAQGKIVVRLKGGDPFVFGRGGEEMESLMALGIPVDVVPGITAATGCAAAAGIPLTHRDHTGTVTFVSGHAKDGDPALDWAGLAQAKQTLVIYMGVSTAGRIADQLIAHGMDPHIPVAVIENGTLPTQKLASGSLGEIEQLIADHRITGPALLVIGSVAGLAAGAGAQSVRLAAAG
jgi:uroporphyrin-III C-methyltransferase/precorrin-2 dehydrogenase/sirohydrochlorin ferrochelatase